jgi:ferredoxin
MRAMHLAGRCVNCGDCARACPVGIPLNLLTRKLGEEVFKDFGLRAGTTPELNYALATFRPEDQEDFIR